MGGNIYSCQRRRLESNSACADARAYVCSGNRRRANHTPAPLAGKVTQTWRRCRRAASPLSAPAPLCFFFRTVFHLRPSRNSKTRPTPSLRAAAAPRPINWKEYWRRCPRFSKRPRFALPLARTLFLLPPCLLGQRWPQRCAPQTRIGPRAIPVGRNHVPARALSTPECTLTLRAILFFFPFYIRILFFCFARGRLAKFPRPPREILLYVAQLLSRGVASSFPFGQRVCTPHHHLTLTRDRLRIEHDHVAGCFGHKISVSGFPRALAPLFSRFFFFFFSPGAAVHAGLLDGPPARPPLAVVAAPPSAVVARPARAEHLRR